MFILFYINSLFTSFVYITEINIMNGLFFHKKNRFILNKTLKYSYETFFIYKYINFFKPSIERLNNIEI
jgi:hypothetical protein